MSGCADTCRKVQLGFWVPGDSIRPCLLYLIIVETVGLGQSEVEIAQSVDMLLVLIPPGGGDDLQGVKKGIVEIS